MKNHPIPIQIRTVDFQSCLSDLLVLLLLLLVLHTTVCYYCCFSTVVVDDDDEEKIPSQNRAPACVCIHLRDHQKEKEKELGKRARARGFNNKVPLDGERRSARAGCCFGQTKTRYTL